MSNLTDFFGGSGGGGGINTEHSFIFEESTTFTPPFNCTVLAWVVGAGASGAKAHNKSYTRVVTGGGAGGCAHSQLTLSSGTTYTITVGAGGVTSWGNSINANDEVADGQDGGTSSLSGSDITTMTATGGIKGVHGVAGNAVAGGAGGTASGGNIFNSTGGSGGDVAAASIIAATGGGAVGIFGATGTKGGNADTTYTSTHGGGVSPLGMSTAYYSLLGLAPTKQTSTAMELRAGNDTFIFPDADAGAGGQPKKHSSQSNFFGNDYRAQDGGIFAGGGAHFADSNGNTYGVYAGGFGNWGGGSGSGNIIGGFSSIGSHKGGDGVVILIVTEVL
jgi:hypothetical protein